MADVRQTDKKTAEPMSATVCDVMAKGRIARPVEDLDDDTLKAIANSAVSAEHAGLDDLLRVERSD
jgi:hypothetical protein